MIWVGPTNNFVERTTLKTRLLSPATIAPFYPTLRTHLCAFISKIIMNWNILKHKGSRSSAPSTLPTNAVPAWAIEQYGQRDVTQSLHGGPGSPMPSASATNTHSERTSSGPVVKYYKHRGQPQIIYSGSRTLRPSTSTEWRPRNVSDHSSGPSIPIN